ncbi:MAG: GH92 family glycosyl hydrolase [Alistipes sp.]
MNCKTTFGLKLLAVALLATSCAQHPAAEDNLTRYVDPMIGTGGHGHVFVGADVPFGAVQLGPTSIPQSWDWVSGYHISDSTVIGFAHTHLNGTGIGDLSDISLMPVVGEVRLARGTQEDPQSGMWSYSDRSHERVRPGYYATRLSRYGVDVELTATERVGFHKYIFPKSADAAVVIDLENGTCWDEPTEGYLEPIDDHTVCGYRYSKGWANDQRVYFVAEFSKPFSQLQLFAPDSLTNGACEGKQLKGKRIYGKALFDTTEGETIYVKVALSPVSVENARLNLQTELPAWDFEATTKAADQKWNAELNKVKIATADEHVKRTFYTALYHTMVAPSLFCDVNGDYRGADGNNYKAADFVNYTTFSLWDTYRAAHPLMTLIHPEKMRDMVQTMLHIYQQQGKLPVWHLAGCETNCMVGNPGICVVADAVMKEVEGVDPEQAFEAMKQSAMLDERGLDLLKEYGYIPCDKMLESVAISMEYAIADGALAAVAQKLGKTEDYNYFKTRSEAYKHYFDPQTHLMRGKCADGTFRTPFNPFFAAHRENDYCEGNAWQYTWLVPHDVKGLTGLFGGREQLIANLDSLFTASADLGENASPDMSGMIGQYVHGNEPSHHILYLYTMAGEPWKTADKVREVLSTLYHDQPDGLAGNEDVGQMSAWYVLSSLGFYQVEPAGGHYYFGSPIVDEAIIKVKGGTFTLTARNNSVENKYIQRVTLNGKPYAKNYIDYRDITAGGTLELEMGAKPCVWYPVE